MAPILAKRAQAARDKADLEALAALCETCNDGSDPIPFVFLFMALAALLGVVARSC
jgi:hypothetical protein